MCNETPGRRVWIARCDCRNLMLFETVGSNTNLKFWRLSEVTVVFIANGLVKCSTWLTVDKRSHHMGGRGV